MWSYQAMKRQVHMAFLNLFTEVVLLKSYVTKCLVVVYEIANGAYVYLYWMSTKNVYTYIVY